MIIFKLIIRHKFSYVNKIVFIKIKWLKKLFRSKFWSEVSWSLDWYGRESLFKTLLTSFSDQKPKNILVANFMTWIIFKEIIPDRRNLIYKNYGNISKHLMKMLTPLSPFMDHSSFDYLTVSVVLTWVSFAPPSTTKVLTQNVPSVTISFRFYFIMIHNHTWMFMSLASDHEAENMSSTPGGPHNNWINEISFPKILDIG